MTDYLIGNYIQIEKMILNGDKANVPHFKEALKVDERTVRRYLRYMKNNLMLPIEYDPHKKIYYYKNYDKLLCDFLEKNKDLVYSIREEEEIKKRDELLNILKSNVTKKGLACKNLPEEIKEHIRSTERNLDSCKTAQEILLYYDFSLRAKTGKTVAEELRKNGLLQFESEEVRNLVDEFRK